MNVLLNVAFNKGQFTDYFFVAVGLNDRLREDENEI